MTNDARELIAKIRELVDFGVSDYGDAIAQLIEIRDLLDEDRERRAALFQQDARRQTEDLARTDHEVKRMVESSHAEKSGR